MKLIVIFHNFVNMPKNDVVLEVEPSSKTVHAFDKNETKQIVKHMNHLKNALSIINL
jgi:ribosomal protein L21E